MKKYKLLILNCNSKNQYREIVSEIYNDKTISAKKMNQLIDLLKQRCPDLEDLREPIKNNGVDYLFTVKQIKKFFNVLDKLNRSVCNYYLGYDTLNPHIAPCQRQVFVNRTIGKWFTNKYYNYWEGKEYKSKIFKYINNDKIIYYLGYGNEVTFNYSDAANGFNLNNSFKISHNDALNLIGVEITKEKFNEINELFKYE